MHYWGDRSLKLITGMLGRAIRIDNAIKNKDIMQFARVLVELDVNQGFHDLISFTNEDDELVSIKVQYDWKPQVCGKCNRFRNLADSCKVGIT